MAQKPVLTPLMAKLEPIVEETYKRHVDTATPWYAHDFVPFDMGKNFAFLGGEDWDESSVTLPKHITDALEILLITKDNLASYHRELVEHFILEDWWGMWLGRWTAEEHLHAVVLREYLVVTREVDPVASEEVRVQHVMKGYRADRLSKIETLVFMAFFEREHAVFCRRLAAQIEDANLRKLVNTIAVDEERHAEFFDVVVRACLEIEPDETRKAILVRADALAVLGADIDAYPDKVSRIADAGIFGEDDLRHVISDSVKSWGVADHPDLSPLAR